MTDARSANSCHAGSPEGGSGPPAKVVVHRFDAIASTNDPARAWLRQHTGTPDKGVFVAREQTAGRATRGRSWASPPGGLWLSMATPLPSGPDRCLPGLGLRVGLAMLRAARDVLPPEGAARLRLRWPNDLVGASPAAPIRKAGGVLVEHTSEGALIGIGINANNPLPTIDDRGEALRTPPIALSELAGQPVDLGALEQRIIEHLLDLVPLHGLPDPVLAELERDLYRPDHPVSVRRHDGSAVSGRIRGLSTANPTLGGLVLAGEDGRETIVTGGDICESV